MLNDYFRAWHAGVARWGNTTDINSASIGIELDNNGFEPFTESQLLSLLCLLDTLKCRYNIPTANFIGHADIAPARKVDPSAQFPWQQLAEKGFGLWYRVTAAIVLPEGFNQVHALRMVGYDTRDSATINASIRAFKRHYIPADSLTDTLLSEGEKKMLFSIYQQSLL